MEYYEELLFIDIFLTSRMELFVCPRIKCCINPRPTSDCISDDIISLHHCTLSHSKYSIPNATRTTSSLLQILRRTRSESANWSLIVLFATFALAGHRRRYHLSGLVIENCGEIDLESINYHSTRPVRANPRRSSRLRRDARSPRYTLRKKILEHLFARYDIYTEIISHFHIETNFISHR